MCYKVLYLIKNSALRKGSGQNKKNSKDISLYNKIGKIPICKLFVFYMNQAIFNQKKQTIGQFIGKITKAYLLEYLMF